MRHTGGSENQSHTEGNLVQRSFHEEARLKEALPGIYAVECDTIFQHQLGNMVLNVRAVDDLVEEEDRIETGFSQNKDRKQGGARHEQTGLDDLNPGCGGHAAEDDVADHQDTNADDGGFVWYTDEQSHQLACANHLGSQVEGRNGNG